jgi:hypothetical protein
LIWEACRLKTLLLPANTLEELITTKLLDFAHPPDFHKPENTTFRKLDLFPSSGEGGGTYSTKKTKNLPFHRPVQRQVFVFSVE